jgi:MFS family permease
MSVSISGPTEAGAYAANIRRFYLFRLLAGFQLWGAIWVLYLQRERGLSLAEVTLLDGPFWLVIVLAEIPTGAVADRWGRKLSLLLGGLSLSVAILVFGLATSFWWLLLSYLVWGIANTLESGADAAFLYDSLSAVGRAEEFPRVLGRVRACDLTAGTLGALVGAPLAAATSLATPIIVSAGLTLLGVLVVLSFREPHRHGAGPRPHYAAILRQAAGLVVHTPALRAAIALRAVVMAVSAAGMIFFQPFLAELDVPVENFGLLRLPRELVAIAGSLVAYRLAARLGERAALSALGAGVAVGLLALGAVTSLLGVLLFALVGFCTAALGPLTSALVNRHAPAHLRATVMSVAQMTGSVGLLLSEPALGLVADRWSLQAMFLCAGAAVTVLGAITLAKTR